MKKMIVAIMILGLIVITGCSNEESNTTSNVVIETQGDSMEPESVSYSAEEVAEHNISEDCWTILDDKVLDMTEFMTAGKHKPVDELCGTDITEELNGQHPGKVKGVKEKYSIGDLK